MFVKKGHELGEILLGKVVGPEARVEGRKAKVDRIRTSCDGSTGAVPVSGWGKKFGCEVGLQSCSSVEGNVERGKAGFVEVTADLRRL